MIKNIVHYCKHQFNGGNEHYDCDFCVVCNQCRFEIELKQQLHAAKEEITRLNEEQKFYSDLIQKKSARIAELEQVRREAWR